MCHANSQHTLSGTQMATQNNYGAPHTGQHQFWHLKHWQSDPLQIHPQAIHGTLPEPLRNHFPKFTKIGFRNHSGTIPEPFRKTHQNFIPETLRNTCEYSDQREANSWTATHLLLIPPIQKTAMLDKFRLLLKL